MNDGVLANTMSGFALFVIAVYVIFVIASLILFVYAFVDLLQRDFRDPVAKWAWFACIFLAPLIGPIIYLAAGRSQGKRKV